MTILARAPGFKDPQRTALAVVGVSALFPGSQDACGFWRDIRAGADLLTEVPPSHWLPEDHYDPDPSAPDKVYAKRGGFLSQVEFDAAEWGVPPKVLRATDTAQLLALIVAEKVLRDAARTQFETMDRSRISVILGVTSALEMIPSLASRLQKPIWVKSLREHGLPEEEVQAICQRIADHYLPWEENSFPGLLGNVVAGRIANRLNLGGTNCVVDAACASALGALTMAAQELYLGESDLVITGGVDALNDIFMFTCFSKTPALSPTGDCRPFSDAADGTMLGEGLGMVALKRLADAERDGDPVYAVLKGIGSSSDGRAKSVYAPVPKGQTEALGRAQAHAGFEPRTIELVEAHGTGTKAGDAAEFEGLKAAFPAGDSEQDRQWCALGSVKSQIGHTKGAAGAAGLFKAVMALQHKVLPPTIKVNRPNPNLGLEASAFYLNTVARPWIRGSSHPRRAGVSSFGFGGTNFHVLLEEYLGPGPRAGLLRAMPSELLVFSGRDGREVAAKAQAMAARGAEPGLLAWAAFATQAEFNPGAPARLALVASDSEPWGERLGRAAARVEAEPDSRFALPDGTAYGLGPVPAGTALLFPGQGSQYLGMGADLAMHFPAARGAWDRASDRVSGLERVVFPPPRFDPGAVEADERRLRETRWAQPAIGCASAALLALVRDLGLEASALAGHSFGEVTALYAAGVLSEAGFLLIARQRGELMAEAGSLGLPGTMSAVMASAERIRQVLAGSGSSVVLANLNGPDQTVISGPVEAIASAEAALEREDIQVQRLPVASAFHSPQVAGSAVPFTAFLERHDFAPARARVYSGASAAPYEADPASQRSRLGRQLAEPVDFFATVTAMADSGIHTFIEVGPGSVLTGLVDRILADRPHVAVALDRRGGNGVTALLKGLARLAALGMPMRLPALWEGYRTPEDPAARPKPKLPIFICGANEKPYPPPGGAAILPKPNPTPPRELPLPAQTWADRFPVAADPRSNAIPVTGQALAPSGLPGPAAAGAGLEWLNAWREAQRQTTEAHGAYLRTMDSSLQRLVELATGRPSAPAVPALPELARMAPALAPPVLSEPGPAPAVLAQLAPPPPSLLPVAPALALPAGPGLDLQALMLAVVAEKTGYPQDMLNLSMDMEAELGIDSIKRVEILAAVLEKAEGVPPVDPVPLGTMRTLAEIVDYLQSLTATGAPEAQPAPAPAAATPPALGRALDLQALMLAVVAEKTGYPLDLLDLSMDMESELGIDSIKRVEILAAVEAKAEGLPPLDPVRLGTMRTLAQIVDYLRGPQAEAAPGTGPVPASAPTSASGEPKAGLGRYVLDLVPAPALGMGRPGLRGASEVVVTADGGEVAVALVAELQGQGIPAHVAEAVPATADAVIFLGGLRPVASGEEALAINHEAFEAARAVAPGFTQRPGLFVTVQDTGGGFGLTGCDPLRALLGGLPALVKTARQEWPQACLGAIDLDRGGHSPASLARILAQELLSGGPELEVGLAATGERRTLRSVAAPLPPGPGRCPIGPVDVVVVSGGGRGVTAACVVEWARRSGARFLLLGRSRLKAEPPCCEGVADEAGLKLALLALADAAGVRPSPLELSRQVSAVLAGREIHATLEAVIRAGGEARYLSVDVQNPGEVAAALETARLDWGPVTALVHGAGVLADKRIADLDDEGFNAVFATKVAGLRVLLAATASDPLKVLCLFSSVSARCGNQGQAAYAMANEVLNKVAQAEARKRGAATLVKSLGWGPWEGGMVSPPLRAQFARLGVPMIPLGEGARMFADEMAGGDRAGVELVLGGEPRSLSFGDAALWVDGKRLYEASNLDMRIVDANG